MQAQAAAASKMGGAANVRPYRDTLRAVNSIRAGYTDAIASMDDYQVRQLKLMSQTDRLTESLRRQKMTFSDIIKNRRALGEVYREQIALQNSLANMWGTDAKGAIKADLIVPKDLNPKLNTLTSKLGYMNQLMLVGADHMVKWGKNMQWAGRQLSMGFTLPVVLAGAVAGKFAYDVDKALTQVVKVYGDANATLQESNAAIREDTLRTAKMMTTMYGQAVTDTIEITAQLAAAGRTGTQLQQDTAAVTRARVLGELDLQDAMKATITMQSVYGYNSEQLGDAFNYINAMENQTVLTAQDFVTAIPKVSGVMNTLGGDLKDVGALMTAFKGAGIDAAEGANALKSINFRLVATYTKGLQTFQQATGQSLAKIVADTGGKTVPTLIKFADAIKGLSAVQKVAVTRDVFGIYQGSKALTMLEQLTGQTEQLSRAFAVGNNSVEENAAIAAKEIQTLNAQPFMKLKKAVEELKNSLIDMGDGFMKAAVPIIQTIIKMVHWFESLPDSIKKGIKVSVLLVAIAGPLIMLTGLFANLFGQVFKLAGTLTKLIIPFKLLTAEEAAEQLVAKRSLIQWNASQTALGRLKAVVDNYTKALTTNTAAQAANNKAAVGSTLIGPAQGNRGLGGMGIVARPTPTPAAGGTGRAPRAVGGGLLTAGLVGSMVAPDNKTGSGISSLLLTTGMLLTLMPSLGTKVAQGFGKAGQAVSRFAPKLSGVTKGLASIAPIAGPAGIALAAVAAGALFVWNRTNKEIKETQERLDNISNSGKAWAQVLGFGYSEQSPLQRQKNSPADIIKGNIKALKEAGKEGEATFKMLQGSQGKSDGEKWGIAISEGLKVRLHGGSEQAAKDATETALSIMKAGIGHEAFKVKIGAEIDFSDMNAIMKHSIDDVAKTAKDAFNGAFNTEDGGWETFARFWTGNNDINSVAAGKLKDKIQQFYQVFAGLEGTERENAFKKIRDAASADLLNVFNNLDMDKAKGAGINNFNDFIQAVGGGMSPEKLSAIGVDTDYQSLQRMYDVYKNFVQVWGEANDIDPKILAQIKNFDTLAGASNVTVTALGQSMNRSANSAEYAAGTLDKTGAAATGAGDGFDWAGYRAESLAGDIDTLNTALSSTGVSFDTISSAVKDAMNKSMTLVTKLGDDALSVHQDAVMESVKANGDAALAAIDKQADALDKKVDDMKKRHDQEEKALNDTYDKRIQKVQDAIDAEQKAEEIRQRIFEAEQTRLQRMATMANSRIDFSMAMRSGNLDEAARVQTAASGQAMQWALDDSGLAGQDASKARVDALSNQKDALENSKKAALDALKAKQDQEDEKLKIENEGRKKSIDAEKKKQERVNKINEDSAKRQNELNQWKANAEIESIMAVVPKTEAERKEQIAKIQAVYTKYGADFTVQAKGWTKIIGNEFTRQMKVAADGLRDQVDWATVGNQAIADLIQGGLGMTIPDLQKFLETGEYKKTHIPTAKELQKNFEVRQKGIANKMKANPGAFHTGGIVGMSDGGRTGFAGAAPRSSREIDARLLAGESVLNKRATNLLGTDFVNNANKGGIGGPDLMMPGMAGMLGGVAAAAGKAVALAGAVNAYNKVLNMQQLSDGMDLSVSALAGQAGKYGGNVFNADQMRNAATIISTGKSLGATSRDLIIALMTAMQESGLRNLNYGDRDSLGLFQQRNAWGTASQRTNPVDATRMFFRGGAAGQRGLFDFPNRDKMSLAQAAQAVQVSAFPDAYAKWEDEARAILSGTSLIKSGTGPFTKPLSNYRLSSGYGYRTHPITGKRTFHDGIDMAAAMGTPIHAALGGRVNFAGWNGGYGNYTSISSGNLLVGYGHQSRIGVHAGQSVGQGSIIGAVGSTGASTGPHLHLLTKRNGRSVDPRSVFPGLRDGGFTLTDGYAKLHKKEAVLTAPLTQDLTEGIKNMDKSTHSRYDITIDNRGATFNTEVDFQKSVEKAIAKADQRRGVSRKVG